LRLGSFVQEKERPNLYLVTKESNSLSLIFFWFVPSFLILFLFFLVCPTQCHLPKKRLINASFYGLTFFPHCKNIKREILLYQCIITRRGFLNVMCAAYFLFVGQESAFFAPQKIFRKCNAKIQNINFNTKFITFWRLWQSLSAKIHAFSPKKTTYRFFLFKLIPHKFGPTSIINFCLIHMLFFSLSGLIFTKLPRQICKIFRNFALGLKILRFFRLKVLFEADIIKGWC